MVGDIAEVRSGHLPNTSKNSLHLIRGVQRLVLKLNPTHKGIFPCSVACMNLLLTSPPGASPWRDLTVGAWENTIRQAHKLSLRTVSVFSCFCLVSYTPPVYLVCDWEQEDNGSIILLSKLQSLSFRDYVPATSLNPIHPSKQYIHFKRSTSAGWNNQYNLPT